MTYDVFISAKSEDYVLAEEVCKFLTENGLSVFFAPKELRNIGRADYSLVIDEVIGMSAHMIVVATSVDYINSSYVKHEWTLFSSALIHGHKNGNLMTIKPQSIDCLQLPMTLRYLQSFSPDNYREQIIDYLNQAHGVIQKRLDAGGNDIRKKTPTEKIPAVNSVFKFYSNENCIVKLDDKVIATVVGKSEEPFCYEVSRKGTFRFVCINVITGESMIKEEPIDVNEEKIIYFEWENRNFLVACDECISGNIYEVKLGQFKVDMVKVEGGNMQIGATKEQEEYADKHELPVQRVTLPTFYMGKFPITQNVWEKVMGYNQSHFRDRDVSPERLLGGAVGGLLGGAVGGLLGGVVGGIAGLLNADPSKSESISLDVGHYPAENLTYDEALVFVQRLSAMTNISFDLPTEAEWEYAARGGQLSRNYRYAGSNNIDDVAWYRKNSEGHTHPVGEKQPNELGLYDMCGNVWEWTKTPACAYGVEGKLNDNIFVRRGGSWCQEEKNCRVSRRYMSERTNKTSGWGLRVVIRENIESLK